MTSLKKKWHSLAIAAALAVGVGAAGNAQAGVLAQSVLQVTDFTFTDGAGTPLDTSIFATLLFTDSTDLSATLNGTTDADSLNQNFFGPLDLNQQCVGACGGFAENDFSPRLVQTVEVARADSLLLDSPISGTGFPVGADAFTVAEVQVAPNSDGSSEGNLGLVASFIFEVNEETLVGIEFDADIWLIASITADMGIGSSAQASSSWSISLTAGGVEVFSWTPDGQPGGIDGGTEIADDCDLTAGRGTNFPGTTSTFSCSGEFSAVTNFLLLPGVQYELSLRHESTADATAVAQVPEPSALSLLGLGLLGLAFGLRRGSKVAA